MPDIVRLLRDLADAYEREQREEEVGEASKATEDRIAALEAQLAKTPADDKADAVEELTDEEWKLIEQHRAGGAGGAAPASAPPPPEQKPEEKPARPRQRVTEGLPQLWSGDDEPDHVEYEDEEGAVKVRKGRKRGQPYGWKVEDIEDAAA